MNNNKKTNYYFEIIFNTWPNIFDNVIQQGKEMTYFEKYL